MLVYFVQHMKDIEDDASFKSRNVIDIIDSDSSSVVSAKRMKQAKQSKRLNQTLLSSRRFRTLTLVQELRETSYCSV